MKISAALGIIVFIISSVLLSGAVMNPDKPIKGQWGFKPQQVWEVFEANEDVIVSVSGIEVDDAGRVYALDWKHTKIFVFGPDGKFLFSFGKKGEGPGEFKMPDTPELVGKHLIVPDSAGFHYFTPDGKYLRTYKRTGGFFYEGVWLDEHRFVFTNEVTKDKKKINRLKLLDTRDDSKKVLAKLEAEETMSAQSGGIRLEMKSTDTTPMVILGGGDGSLFFGKNDKYQIRKTGTDGKEIMSFGIKGRDRKPISEALKRKQFESVSLNGGKMPEDMIKQMIKGVPDEMTYFKRIHIDESGMIYIYLTDMANKTGQELDIFSPDGKYLYHADLKLPEGLKTYGSIVFKGNYIYVFVEDEEGERKLVKFKVKKPKI